jgi:predicted deacylase
MRHAGAAAGEVVAGHEAGCLPCQKPAKFGVDQRASALAEQANLPSAALVICDGPDRSMIPSIDAMYFKSISYTGASAGPKLIVLGAVHGNETCGSKAIRRVIDDIESNRIPVSSGTVTFVPVTNPLAWAKGERGGDRNLNRNLAPTPGPMDFEDHVANWLCPLLAQHEFLLDLHSTQARNEAFAMLGPHDNAGTLQPYGHSRRERSLALRLGVRRFVDGWLDTYAIGVERRVGRLDTLGTRAQALNTDARYGVGTTEYMRSVGGSAVTLECGQHEDPAAQHVGYQAILNTLAHLQIVSLPSPAPVTDFDYLTMYEVTDRDHAEDSFARDWSSFDCIEKGELIGARHDGKPVIAQDDGYILFPNAKALPNNEWFYLAKLRSQGELLPRE